MSGDQRSFFINNAATAVITARRVGWWIAGLLLHCGGAALCWLGNYIRWDEAPRLKMFSCETTSVTSAEIAEPGQQGWTGGLLAADSADYFHVESARAPFDDYENQKWRK